jgi:hypothetical protein
MWLDRWDAASKGVSIGLGSYAGYLAAGGWAYQLQLAELRAVQGAQNAAASGTSVTGMDGQVMVNQLSEQTVEM